MNKQQRYTEQMVSRVYDFGVRHAELLPKQSAAVDVLEALHQDLLNLRTNATGQVSGSGSIRTSRSSRIAARNELQSMLERIHLTARALELEKFIMPRTHSDQTLLDSGEAFANDAEPFKQEFVQHGLPATFIEDLKKAVENLRDAKLELAAGIAVRKSTAAAFEDTLKKTADDLARFDALVANTMSDNPAIMAEWNHIRRVGRPPSRRKQTSTAPSSPQPEPVHTGT